MSAFEQIPNMPPVLALTGTEMFELVQNGSTYRGTISQIVQFFLGNVGTFVPTRIVASNADTPILLSDMALLVDKTIAGATVFTLPGPALGRVLLFKDMKGDADVNNITLDAGTGHLINNQQTLVMDAQWETTLLIGASSTLWGTII